jgi:hypothetical protein
MYFGGYRLSLLVPNCLLSSRFEVSIMRGNVANISVQTAFNESAIQTGIVSCPVIDR